MLNRTAGTLGRNATTPLSPALLKLEPEQRVRLIKSSQKVGRVLGAMPTIDVVSPTIVTFTPPTTPRSGPTPLGNVRSLFAQHSPVAFIHSAAAKVSAYEDSPKSPVVHYKINVTQEVSTHVDMPASATRRVGNKLRRKHVPAALPLPQAQRTEALPLSPFRYGVLRSVHTPALSPLSPMSPFSPITEAKIEQNKLEKLEKLEKLAQCANVDMPQALIYPSFGQVEEKAETITSFLDLYRMRAQDDGDLFTTSRVIQREESEVAELMEPESRDAAGRTDRRRTRGMSMQKRRSRSVGDFYSFAHALELQSPRFSSQQERRFSRFAANSQIYAVPPPTAVSASPHPFAAVVSPSVYSQASAEAEDDGDIAVLVPSPPFSPAVSPRLQRQRSFSRAKQTILGADAKLMAEFRTGFGTRPLDFTLPFFPPPTGPLPSPPVSPSLAGIKSPKVPYWVKGSFRPRNSAEALQLIGSASRARTKRVSRVGQHATPRTVRFERRMGWGGQWNQGNMAGMIDSLKEL